MRNNSSRRGLALTEFALLAPVVFMLMLGIIETGNIFYSWLTVQKAAQVASRIAATGQGDDEGTRDSLIQTAATELLTELKQGESQITLRSWPDLPPTGDGITNSAGGPCQLVQVSIEYTYHPMTPLMGDLLPETISIHGVDRKVNEPWKPCDE